MRFEFSLGANGRASRDSEPRIRNLPEMWPAAIARADFGLFTILPV